MRSIFLACIMLLIVEGTKEVSAFPADASLGVERSANTADSLIPVKKGKGHGDRDERFERHPRWPRIFPSRRPFTRLSRVW